VSSCLAPDAAEPQGAFKTEHLLTSTVSNELRGVPEAVAPFTQVMSTYGAPWSLCGGWAVDAWLGELTREHGDVDISVFAQDQRALYDHLRGWQLLAHDASWAPNNADRWWDGEQQITVPGHFHARAPELSGPVPADGIATTEDGFILDIQVDDRMGGEWVLSREPLLTVPLRDAVQMSPWGVPMAAPELLLFFKARDMRRRDKLDFQRLLPRLSPEKRAWLHDALALVGHPWLAELRR
jgi:hypothetical protein